MESLVVEVNVVTGEILERELNKEEIEQLKANKQAEEKRIADEQATLEAKNTAKESAKLKLSQLGLNEEEINAMLGL